MSQGCRLGRARLRPPPGRRRCRRRSAAGARAPAAAGPRPPAAPPCAPAAGGSGTRRPESTTTSRPWRSAASRAGARRWRARRPRGSARRPSPTGAPAARSSRDREDRGARVDHATAALVDQRQRRSPGHRRRRRKPRAQLQPGPRTRPCARRPQSAATASNRRPMLVVSRRHGGALGDARHLSQRPGSISPASVPGTGGRSPRARREPGACHAPRLVHGTRAAGHAHRPQRRRALERHEVADQHLAAPDRAVRPVARAVVDRTHRRALEAVLGEARRQVRMVVLDARQLDPVELERVGGRGVVGVEVVGDELGPQARTAARSARSPAGRRAAPDSARGRRCGG